MKIRDSLIFTYCFAKTIISYWKYLRIGLKHVIWRPNSFTDEPQQNPIHYLKKLQMFSHEIITDFVVDRTLLVSMLLLL